MAKHPFDEFLPGAISLVEIPNTVGVLTIDAWPGENGRPFQDISPLCLEILEKMPAGLTNCIILSRAPGIKTAKMFSVRLFQIILNTDERIHTEIHNFAGVVVGKTRGPNGSVAALMLTGESARQFEAEFKAALAQLKPDNISSH